MRKIIIATLGFVSIQMASAESIPAQQTSTYNGLVYKLFSKVPFTGQVTGVLGICDMQFKKGILDGPAICKSRSRLLKKYNHKNGKKDGLEEIYDEGTGNLSEKINWKFGLRDGDSIQYNPKTKKSILKVSWKGGKQEGPEQRWSDEGELMTSLVWKDGKQTGYISTGGNSGYEFNTYKDGILHGPRRIFGYKSNGERYQVSERNYINGKIDGVAKAVDANNNITVEAKYKGGIPEYALLQTWRDGKLVKRTSLINTQKDESYQYGVNEEEKFLKIDGEQFEITDRKVKKILWDKGIPLTGEFSEFKRGILSIKYSGITNPEYQGALVKHGLESRYAPNGKIEESVEWKVGVPLKRVEYDQYGKIINTVINQIGRGGRNLEPFEMIEYDGIKFY